MQIAAPSASASQTIRRTFRRDGVIWTVSEADGRAVPGSKGAVCLVFDSPDLVRRLWIFPATWSDLDDDALWTLSERSVRMSARFNGRSGDLASAICAALANINRSQDLVAGESDAATRNHDLRRGVAELLSDCRAERNYVRDLVQTQAEALRAEGISAEDASLFIASAFRESAAQLHADGVWVKHFERVASRWCAHAYHAA